MKKRYILLMAAAATMSAAWAQNTHKELEVRDNGNAVVASVPLSQINYVQVVDKPSPSSPEIDFSQGVTTAALNPQVTSGITTINCQEALVDIMYDLENDWGVSGTMLNVMEFLVKTENYSETTAFSTFSFTYESIAADGTPITLSAQLAYPNDPTLDDEANRPTNVVLYNHFTITQNAQAPSNMVNLFSFQNTLAAMWANSKRRSLVILPDYEGYGVSADRSHPFVQQGVLARQGLDAMRAGMQLYEQLELPALTDDWTSITYGASQGGGQAVAVHRLIEQTGLADELRFQGSVSSGGPYDPLMVLRALMQSETSSYPALYPLTIVGLCENSPYLTDVAPEEFFTPEMLEMGIVDIIRGKELNTTQLWVKMLEYDTTHDNALGYNAENRNFLTSKIIRQPIIDAFNGGEPDARTRELVERLELAISASGNRLEQGWEPQAPTILIHSAQDTYVAYPNFLETERAWVGNKNAHFFHYDGEILKHHNSLTGISLIGLSRLECDVITKGFSRLLPFDMHVEEPQDLINMLMNAGN